MQWPLTFVFDWESNLGCRVKGTPSIAEKKHKQQRVTCFYSYHMWRGQVSVFCLHNYLQMITNIMSDLKKNRIMFIWWYIQDRDEMMMRLVCLLLYLWYHRCCYGYHCHTLPPSGWSCQAYCADGWISVGHREGCYGNRQSEGKKTKQCPSCNLKHPKTHIATP